MVPSGMMCVQRNMRTHTQCMQYKAYAHGSAAISNYGQEMERLRILCTLARIPKTLPTFDC